MLSWCFNIRLKGISTSLHFSVSWSPIQTLGLLTTLLSLFWRLHQLNGKKVNSVSRFTTCAQLSCASQLPVTVSELKHYQFQQNWNSRQRSVTCQQPASRHMLRKKGSGSLGHLRQANRIQVFLQIRSTANWGSKGDIHRTHPVAHLSELWASWSLLWGQGVESRREPGSWWGETWEWTRRSFCYSKHILQDFTLQWNVKCYFCIIT